LVGGEVRVNEQPGLATMHTVWFREHNRIASKLESMNGNWDAERVFQETRRILSAEYQHIIYQEWLPILLGTNFMRSKNLLPTTDEYTRNYDDSIDPRINNEFSTAAFRFGHSMVSKEIFARDKNFDDRTKLTLDETFFNSTEFETDRDFVEKTVRGQIVEKAQAWDPGFNDDFINHLMAEDLDLIALNIQRGREHGIPGYNAYRKVCASGTYKGVRSFTDLNDDGFLSGSDVRKLEQFYEHIDDIDLFVAGVLEARHEDALVGPAFKCIIGDQFIRLKEGDRFWYENGLDSNIRFTTRQLKEIKQTSMARVVCDNTNVDEIQPLVFRTETNTNKVTPCSDLISIPKLDLEPWRE
jgi:peroxidase